MFTLNYKIDDKIEFNEEVCDVNMAFDNILRLYDMFDDEELSDVDKVYLGVQMLLGKLFEHDFETHYDILQKLIKGFIQTDEVEVQVDRQGNPLPKKVQKPVYSFKHDAEYVYSSFMQAYGIDLIDQQGKLHWIKFKALFDGLPDNTKFRQVVDIRTRPYPKGKGTAEDKRALREMKKLYALPGEVIEEEE